MPVYLLAAEGANPPNVQHVVPHGFLSTDLFGMHNVWTWSTVTANLLLAGIITTLVMIWAAAHIKTGPQSKGNERFITRNPFAHMIEVICAFLRDQTVRPLLGERTDRMMPFLWTIFFFILINNLLGLVPILDIMMLAGPERWHHEHTAPLGGTATQSIWVTGALALIAALVINGAGIKELGVGGYLKHLTAGTPVYLWPLMIPIEIIGTIIKPVALAIRLFANMTAGHILVATLLMFAGIGLTRVPNGLLGGGVSVVSVIGAIAIYFLELFVAFLQAFVFTFLTTVFISQLSHHHDHHEHGDVIDHEHAHA